MNWDDVTDVSGPEDIARGAGKRDKAYLIVLAGSNVGEMYLIDGDTTVGRGADADLRLTDDGISRLHCRIRAIGDTLSVEDLDSRNGTYCNGRRITERSLSDGDKIQVGRTTILKFTYHDLLEESFQRQMFDSALRDPLTRAYNKRYFDDRLVSELRFSLRHQTPLALLLFDLDHFKQINDERGHVAGDKALVVFSAHMRATIRNEDVFARYGGEEFAIITRGIRRRDALSFAERLRREVSRLLVEHDSDRFGLTTCVGVATIPENPAVTPAELTEAADHALYEAKDGGRNRVVLAAEAAEAAW
jgi:diguanylate cyclase (GGDEF)-like protein